MTLTQKERGLLTELAEQEKLCYEKYERYSQKASAPELATLFSELSNVENTHYKTVSQMLDGTVPVLPQPSPAKPHPQYSKYCYKSQKDKDEDEFFCKDMLAMEKHVSALYDTSVFEFCNTDARNVLNHVQSEEQEHGDKLYKFMSANGMYN